MIATINSAIAKKREEGEKGFTLIELLVVILIIGVLAAIAIPVFLNQRQAAWESQVKSDIANAVIAAEGYAVDHNGSYLGLDHVGGAAAGVVVGADDNGEAQLKANGYNDTPSVNLTVTTATANEYVFTVEHDEYTDPTWTYTHSTGVTLRTP